MTSPRCVMMPRQYVTAPPLGPPGQPAPLSACRRLARSQGAGRNSREASGPGTPSILPRPARGTTFASTSYTKGTELLRSLGFRCFTPLPSRTGDAMLIRLGYEMVFEASVATPMLLLLYVHPSRATTLK